MPYFQIRNDLLELQSSSGHQRSYLDHLIEGIRYQTNEHDGCVHIRGWEKKGGAQLRRTY